jgi:hypothetical protein
MYLPLYISIVWFQSNSMFYFGVVHSPYSGFWIYESRFELIVAWDLTWVSGIKMSNRQHLLLLLRGGAKTSYLGRMTSKLLHKDPTFHKYDA